MAGRRRQKEAASSGRSRKTKSMTSTVLSPYFGAAKTDDASSTVLQPEQGSDGEPIHELAGNPVHINDPNSVHELHADGSTSNVSRWSQ
jgi:hypothetical protein